jgi:hypothetical protein
MRATANKQAGSKISKRQETKEKEIKALTEKAIDKLTIKRQAICRLREGLREGKRVANLFSLPFLINKY